MKDYTYFKASFQYAVLGMMMMLEKYHLLRPFFKEYTFCRRLLANFK